MDNMSQEEKEKYLKKIKDLEGKTECLEDLIHRKLSKLAHNTAPETDKRLTSLERAIFGDGRNKGMQQMVKDMHDIFTGVGFMKKIFVWCMGVIGVIISIALGIKQLFKD